MKGKRSMFNTKKENNNSLHSPRSKADKETSRAFEKKKSKRKLKHGRLRRKTQTNKTHCKRVKIEKAEMSIIIMEKSNIV